MTNPELRKHFWLEISKHRLFLLLGIIGLLLLMIFVSVDNFNELATACISLSSVLIVVFVLWGTLRVYNSINNEISSNTWHFIQSSSLTAWQVTIGKLLGSSIMSLIIIGLALPMHFFSAMFLESFSYACITSIYIIIGTFLVLSLGLFAALAQVSSDKYRTGKSNRSSFVLIVLLVFVISLISSLFDTKPFAPKVDWYFFDLENYIVRTANLLIGLLWTLYGAYRLMLKELSYQFGPVAWCAFVIFLMFYIPGYSFEGTLLTTFIAASSICLICAYLALLIQKIDLIDFKKFINNFSVIRFFINPTTPMLFANTVILFVMIVITTILMLGHTIVDSELLRGLEIDLDLDLLSNAKFVPLLVFIVFIRDFLISFYLMLRGSSKKYFIIYLVLLYGLIPTLFKLINIPIVFLIPWATESYVYGFVTSIIWIAVLWFLIDPHLKKNGVKLF